jgi:hypothetical protein
MKKEVVVGCLAAFLAVMAVAGSAWAQRAGFQAGVVQPQFGVPLPQAPVVAVRSTFTLAPVSILPVFQAVAPVPLVPVFPTVIVPNTILVPGQTSFAVPIVSPASVPIIPVNVAPALPVHLPAHRFPTFGTPRADVLRVLGQPSLTVITSAGETLYFTGGVTVIIQNGQVVGPR